MTTYVQQRRGIIQFEQQLRETIIKEGQNGYLSGLKLPTVFFGLPQDYRSTPNCFRAGDAHAVNGRQEFRTCLKHIIKAVKLMEKRLKETWTYVSKAAERDYLRR
ncbi:MAG TPA: hypothetical protein VN285_04755 [Candidatus Deferrimicrobium sp.]|nr:hypothetical protein [Candidatus Deferrimicrobium sp.]